MQLELVSIALTDTAEPGLESQRGGCKPGCR